MNTFLESYKVFETSKQTPPARESKQNTVNRRNPLLRINDGHLGPKGSNGARWIRESARVTRTTSSVRGARRDMGDQTREDRPRPPEFGEGT